MTHNSIIDRRDSGVIVDIDAKLRDALLESYDSTAANDSSVNNEHAINQSSKRALTHENLSCVNTAEKTPKRAKNNHPSTIAQPRVICPYLSRDPETHTFKVVCQNKGFTEMSRLKQHLVKVHGVPKESLNLKQQSFLSLGNIDAKWRQVFRILFPDVLEEEIPSPCKYMSCTVRCDNADNGIDVDNTIIPKTTIKPPHNNTTLNDNLYSLITQHGIYPDLAARLTAAILDLDKSILLSNPKAIVTSENNGILTPPSSVENSPQLNDSDLAPVETSPPFTVSPGESATTLCSDGGYIDPSIFSAQHAGQMLQGSLPFDVDSALRFLDSADWEMPLLDIDLSSPDMWLGGLSSSALRSTTSTTVDHVQSMPATFDIDQKLLTTSALGAQSLAASTPVQAVDAFIEKRVDGVSDYTGSLSVESGDVDWDEWMAAWGNYDNEGWMDKVTAMTHDVDELFQF